MTSWWSDLRPSQSKLCPSSLVTLYTQAAMQGLPRRWILTLSAAWCTLTDVALSAPQVSRR